MNGPTRTLSAASTHDHQLGVVVDRLYRRHHRTVFRLALRYGLGDEDWAEDVVQDVFMALVDNLERLGDHENLGAWLYRVTTRRCLRKLERRRFRSRPVIRWLLLGHAEVEPSIENRVFARQDLERVRLAVARLPARERVVISMCHLDGKSQREVCEILDLSKGYVSKLLARATARLEEVLRD